MMYELAIIQIVYEIERGSHCCIRRYMPITIFNSDLWDDPLTS